MFHLRRDYDGSHGGTEMLNKNLPVQVMKKKEISEYAADISIKTIICKWIDNSTMTITSLVHLFIWLVYVTAKCLAYA